jgi:hypothetical protein
MSTPTSIEAWKKRLLEQAVLRLRSQAETSRHLSEKLPAKIGQSIAERIFQRGRSQDDHRGPQARLIVCYLVGRPLLEFGRGRPTLADRMRVDHADPRSGSTQLGRRFAHSAQCTNNSVVGVYEP